MSELRDHTRRALSGTEPSPEEAARALDVALGRTQPRRGRPRPLAVGLGVAAMALAFVLFGRRTTSLSPAAPVASRSGVHLYVRSAGEPEALALRLDLDNQGASR